MRSEKENCCRRNCIDELVMKSISVGKTNIHTTAMPWSLF